MGNKVCMDCHRDVPEVIKIAGHFSLTKFSIRAYKQFTGREWFYLENKQYLCYACAEKRHNRERDREQQSEIRRRQEESRQQMLLKKQAEEKRQFEIERKAKEERRRQEEERRRQEEERRRQEEERAKKERERKEEERRQQELSRKIENKKLFQDKLENWERDNEYGYSDHHLNLSYATKGHFVSPKSEYVPVSLSKPMFDVKIKSPSSNNRRLLENFRLPKINLISQEKQPDSAEYDSLLSSHSDTRPLTSDRYESSLAGHVASSRILRRGQIEKLPFTRPKSNIQNSKLITISRVPTRNQMMSSYKMIKPVYVTSFEEESVCPTSDSKKIRVLRLPDDTSRTFRDDVSDSKTENVLNPKQFCKKCVFALNDLRIKLRQKSDLIELEKKLLRKCFIICSLSEHYFDADDMSNQFLNDLKFSITTPCCMHVYLLKVLMFIYFFLSKDEEFSHLQEYQKFKEASFTKPSCLAEFHLILYDIAVSVAGYRCSMVEDMINSFFVMLFKDYDIPRDIICIIRHDLKWTIPEIRALISKGDKFRKGTFFRKLCHFIQSLRLLPKSLIDDRHVMEYLRNNQSNEFGILWTHLIETEQPKNVECILQDMTIKNLQSFFIYESIIAEESVFIRDVVQDVCRRRNNRIGSRVDIFLDSQSESIVDRLYILSAAVFKTHKFWPNDAQLVSLCFLIQTYTKRKGYLLEIKTGEGKSCVVAMFAAYLSLYSTMQWIDIISSSVVLALRDSLEWTSFFKTLHITSGSNVILNTNEEKELCYKNTIVYGTVASFSSDILRQEFQLENVRGDRTCQVVLVDEVDSLLLDNGIQFTYLSHSVPGMHHLDPILLMIWNEIVRHDTNVTVCGRKVILGKIQPIHEYIASIVPTREGTPLNPMKILRDLEQEGLIEQELTEQIREDVRTYGGMAYTYERSCFKMNIGKRHVLDILHFYICKKRFPLRLYEKDENGLLKRRSNGIEGQRKCFDVLILEGGAVRAMFFDHDELYSLLANKIKKCIEEDKNDTGYKIPRQHSQFITERMVHWIQNGFIAKEMKDGREYVISKNQIVPVDFESTGVLELGTKWGDGLHQFLEIKHFMKLTPLGIVTNFLSNRSYFQRYGNMIYGVTGTIGNNDEKSYLQENFRLKCISIPTYKRGKFTELPGIICSNTKEWHSKIREAVEYESKTQDFRKARAVLVVCEDINTAREVTYMLRRISLSATMYARNDDDNETIRGKLTGGDIIVATNIAGRGTDLKLDRNVVEAGGLFVLATFLPQNTRVEHQIFGRAARKGEPGSARVILDLSKMHRIFETCRSFEEIRQMRDKENKIRLSELESFLRTEINMKETLFQSYCKFLQECGFEFKDETEKKITTNAMHEFWGFWLKKNFQITSKSSLKEKLIEDLNEAKRKVSNQYSSYENMSHIIKFGNECMQRKRYSAAENLYTRAINTDPQWAAVAYYNRAYCRLKQNTKFSLRRALDDLKEAEKNFSNYKYETLLCVALLGVIPRDSTTTNHAIFTQFETRCQILNFVHTNISKGKLKLQEILDDGNSVEIDSMLLFSIIVGDDKWKKKVEGEIFLYWEIGLTEILTLSEARFSWKGALVAALGVLQVAIGIFLAITTSGIILNVGFGFIFEGIRDICVGVSAILKSDNDFITEWMIQKVTRTVTSIALIGINQLGILDRIPDFLPSILHNGLKMPKCTEFFVGKLASKVLSKGKDVFIDIANSKLKERFKTSCKYEIEHIVNRVLKSCHFYEALYNFINYRLSEGDTNNEVINYFNRISNSLILKSDLSQLGPLLYGCVKQVLKTVDKNMKDLDDADIEDFKSILKLFDSCKYKMFKPEELVEKYTERTIKALEQLTTHDFKMTVKQHILLESEKEIKIKVHRIICKHLVELMECSFEQRGSILQAEKAEHRIHNIADEFAPQLDLSVPSVIRDYWN